MKNCLLQVLFLLTAHYVISQTTFQTTVRYAGGGNGFNAIETPDGGFTAVGYSANGLSPSSDILLIRLDSAGDTIWTRNFGGGLDDAGWAFERTTDEGYIITGYTQSYGAGGEDIYLLKTDSSGVLVWSKTYGGINNDRGNSVKQTMDGGFIICGFTESFGAGGSDVCLIKTDSNGDTTWTKTFGGLAADLGSSVSQTAEGGYILSGVANSSGASDGDLLLIRTDLNGDTIWQKAFGGIGYEQGYTVQQTSDGGYISSGYTSSYGSGDDDLYLVKTDSAGNLMWSKAVGGLLSDRGRWVQQTTDGGYIISGWTYSFNSDADAYLLKTDANGDTIWTKTYGGAFGDQVRSARQTADGGYIITGGSAMNSYDFYFIKTDSSGNTGCNQANPAAIVMNPPTVTTNFPSIVMSANTIVNAPSTISGSGADVTAICTSVGILDPEAGNSFKIFPNPSTGNFTIVFSEIVSNGIIEIYNVMGKRIHSESIHNSLEKSFDLEHMSSGIYFIRLNQASFSKFIKY